MNLNTVLLVDGSLMLIGLINFTDDPEEQKEDPLSYFLTAKVTPITAVMSFLIVAVS